MEFSRANLREDFIVGISSESVREFFEACSKELSEEGEALFERGVLITERDPVRFTLTFLLCLEKEIPIILGNPDWSQVEWASFKEQFNPAKVCGTHFDGDSMQTKCLDQGDKGLVFIPTGGSSAQKLKFARHRWSSLMSQARMVYDYLGQAPIDSVCCLPLYHVSGLMQVIRAVVSGGQICFSNLDALPELKTQLELEHFCLSLVPAQLHRMYREDKSFSHLKSYKRIFLGGAPANLGMVNKALEQGLALALCYGMTETAGMVFVQDAFSENGQGGKALPGVSIKLEAVNGAEQIRIHSPSLFEGYHQSPDLDLKAGFLTQDIGYLDSNDQLIITGRADAVIISGGEKIVPQEVESVIRKSEAVLDVLVVGAPSEQWGQSLTAIIVPSSRSQGQFDADALHTFLKEQITNYKLPKRYITVDALPLFENGKINRALLEHILSGYA